ncbi:hypothetical protein [Plantactinospora endophytica]|nr:hypothetical protein [Plantactinospora endophytica]
MASHRRGGLDPDAAERLLDAAAGRDTGTGQPHRDPSDPVAELLTAASAPARAAELAGEEAALQAFRTARAARLAAGGTYPEMVREARAKAGGAASPTTPDAVTGRSRGGRRRLTVGAGGWIAVVLATLTAGAALATDIPALDPADPRRGAPDSGSRTPVPPTTATAPTITTPPTGTTAPTGGPTAAPPPNHSPRSRQATPHPSVYGQCRAYLARGGADSDARANRSPSKVLLEAAGSRSEIERYCRLLLAIDKPNHSNKSRKPDEPEKAAEEKNAAEAEHAAETDRAAENGTPDRSGRSG